MTAEAPTEDTNNALTWPEHSPSVAFSTEFSGNGRRYDVSMPMINSMFDESGIGPERSDLKIIIKPEAIDPWGEPVRGYYDIEAKEAHVGTKGLFVPHVSSKRLNGTLRHEIGHFADKDLPNDDMSAEAAQIERLNQSMGYKSRAERFATKFSRRHRKVQPISSSKIL